MTILDILIAAGETEFAARLAGESGQDKYEVYLTLAKSFLRAKRPREAHDQTIRAWRSVYLDSGYGDHTDGPIDQIAELLLHTGGLRGARFIADDYGTPPRDYAKLAKQMTLYCAILEASIETLNQESGASVSGSHSY